MAGNLPKKKSIFTSKFVQYSKHSKCIQVITLKTLKIIVLQSLAKPASPYKVRRVKFFAALLTGFPVHALPNLVKPPTVVPGPLSILSPDLPVLSIRLGNRPHNTLNRGRNKMEEQSNVQLGIVILWQGRNPTLEYVMRHLAGS
jgi:hypothetical protein